MNARLFGFVAASTCIAMVGAAANRVWSRTPRVVAEDRARQWMIAGIDSLAASVRRLASQPLDRGHLAPAFADARDRYKYVEAIVAHSFPGSADGLNGPPIERMEEGTPTAAVHPEGFQLLEQLIFADDAADTARLRTEIAILGADVRRVRVMAPTLSYSAPLVFAAARDELMRVAVRGLPETDTPFARRGAAEASAAIDGVVAMLAPFATVRRPADPITVSSVIRLARTVDSLRRTLHVGRVPSSGTLWRNDAATLFDSAALDPFAFAPAENRNPPPARIELGERLFFDVSLSGDGRRSCATCHQPSHAFTDARPASVGIDGTRLPRNAPSLIDAALQPALFHDMRTARLEDQAAEVIENPVEMGGDLDAIVRRLSHSGEYVRRFVDAFPPAPRPIDRGRVQLALAAYVRSLVALNAPLDRYLRGDSAAMTTAQRRGLALFMGKARCATCHALPLTSGAVAPAYNEMEGEGLGVPSLDRRRVDPDPGIAARTRFPGDSFHFRTPSLRNVALTAPYMHNGVFRTLRDVVDFYDRGGGAGLGFSATHQTLPTDSLRLSVDEKTDLVAFLSALTDTAIARPRR